MQIVWIAVSLVLAVSLPMRRIWLHRFGLVGCVLLLIHAVEIRDPAFVIVNLACVVAHVIGLLRYGSGGRPRNTRKTRTEGKYWVNN